MNGTRDNKISFVYREEVRIRNSATLKKRHPSLEPVLSQVPKAHKVVTMSSRRGSPTFLYRIGTKKRRYFHSTYDPKSEGQQWANEAMINGNCIVVILGGGFFYHIAPLLPRVPPSCRVVIIERHEEIIREALRTIDLSDVLSRDNLYLLLSSEPDEVIRFLTKLQLTTALKEIRFLYHLPSVETFPEFYRPIAERFTSARKINSYDRLKYKKFCHKEIRVLLITTQYFLMGEITSALKRMGFEYRLATIGQEEVGCQEFLEEVIRNILDFRPDFIFTINHLGMDREGYLSQFLTTIEMPFASWYVDNPNLIIGHYRKNVSPYCALFLWDRSVLPDMVKLGFQHVSYVPLGVDEKRFYPRKNKPSASSQLSTAVSFVGNSMVQKVTERLSKSKVNGKLSSSFHRIAMQYAQSSERHVEVFLKTEFLELYPEFLSQSDEGQANYKTAISWEATRVYRLERVKRLVPFVPLVVGDPHWFEMLNRRVFKYHPEVSYYDELPSIYNNTTINFNATSRQMKGAANQRVFDVPACGAFLLTDWEEQIEDLFEVGKEVVCYRDPEEIEDLVKYYLTHDRQREQVVQQGYARALRDHTYVKRVKVILDTMKKTFG